MTPYWVVGIIAVLLLGFATASEWRWRRDRQHLSTSEWRKVMKKRGIGT
jgi:hypothetical protein